MVVNNVLTSVGLLLETGIWTLVVVRAQPWFSKIKRSDSGFITTINHNSQKLKESNNQSENCQFLAGILKHQGFLKLHPLLSQRNKQPPFI
jgi:hypothetical protein